MNADNFQPPPPLLRYPMPPECPCLPGLASLLNPLKFNNSEYTSELPLLFSSSNGSSSSSTSFSSSARTARCRVCLGCKSEPCGICSFCKDSVPFGGPGIKKQTCIERKCVVLLENRFQKFSTAIKVRTGCNECIGCKESDCQSCLVCYDKKFLNGKYLTGAICRKKECFGVSSCELSLEELKKLQQKLQQKLHRKRPYKRTMKSIDKEKNDKTELPKKPKRVYKRRIPKARKESVSLPDEQVFESETKEECISSDQATNIHPKVGCFSQPPTPVLDALPSLTPPLKFNQSPEIQRYNPSKSVIQLSQLQSASPNNALDLSTTTTNNNFNNSEFKQMQNPTIGNKVMQTFPSMDYQERLMQQHSHYSKHYYYSNGSTRISYRRLRYLRFSNNFDSASSNSLLNKFDPFIPPSYSGNEDVILQAL